MPQCNESFFLKWDVEGQYLLRLLCLDQHVIKRFLDLEGWLSEHTLDVVLRNEEILDAILITVTGYLQDEIPALGVVRAKNAVEQWITGDVLLVKATFFLARLIILIVIDDAPHVLL